MKARAVIAPALAMIQVGSREQPDDAGDMLTGLETLNAMIEQWTSRPNTSPGPTLISIVLTPGKWVYTLGPTGDVVLPRAPCALMASPLGAVPVTAMLDWPARSWGGFDPIVRVDTGWPGDMTFQRGVPNAVLMVSPAPSAAINLPLALDLGLPTFPDLDTDVPDMPPWYLLALQSNLALECSSAFARPVPQAVLLTARRTLDQVTSQNANASAAFFPSLDPALPGL